MTRASIVDQLRPCKKCGVEFVGIRCKPCKRLIPEDKEKAKARYGVWSVANPGEAIARATAWNAAHPDERRGLTQNRRAKLKEIGGVLSKGLAKKLLTLQRGKCACCGLPLGDDYHMDHVMPLSLGGLNIDENVQLLRQRCNNQKSAKHPIDFMQSRGFLL